MGITAMADVEQYTPHEVRVKLYARGIQIKDFADYVGVSRPHLSAVMLGHTKPSALLLRRIARAMREIESKDGVRAL